jgi:predicted nucleic acid-binding protein
VIILDTSGVLAAIDASQHHHRSAAAALRAAQPPRLLSPFVLAELDYLLATRVGTVAELAFLDEVGRGVYQLAPFGEEDVARAAIVIKKYADLELGLADASLVVLAERHAVVEILTLDERHFRAVRRGDARPFLLLPLDETG